MSIKFIDGMKNGNDLFEDEIIVRCPCGCSFMCVRTYDYTDAEGNLYPALEFDNYGYADGGIDNLNFILPDDIVTLLNLLDKSLNDGNGAIVDVEKKVLFVSRVPAQDNVPEALGFLSFKNERAFKAFLKNPTKINKNGMHKALDWEVIIIGADVETFCKSCARILYKKFKNYISRQEKINETSDNK